MDLRRDAHPDAGLVAVLDDPFSELEIEDFLDDPTPLQTLGTSRWWWSIRCNPPLSSATTGAGSSGASAPARDVRFPHPVDEPEGVIVVREGLRIIESEHLSRTDSWPASTHHVSHPAASIRSLDWFRSDSDWTVNTAWPIPISFDSEKTSVNLSQSPNARRCTLPFLLVGSWRPTTSVKRSADSSKWFHSFQREPTADTH